MEEVMGWKLGDWSDRVKPYVFQLGGSNKDLMDLVDGGREVWTETP